MKNNISLGIVLLFVACATSTTYGGEPGSGVAGVDVSPEGTRRMLDGAGDAHQEGWPGVGGGPVSAGGR